MATEATTRTDVTSEALHQLRTIVGKTGAEMQRALKLSSVTCTFNQEKVTKALIAFWLCDVISEVAVVYHRDGAKLCEYRYKLIFETGGIKEYGNDVPATTMPEGTTAKVVVYPNTSQPVDYMNAVFAQYGWTDEKPLTEPGDMEAETYGVFASADESFGISRTRRISRSLLSTTGPKEEQW